MKLHFFRNRAKHKGSCNIRCSLQVVSSAVHHKKAFRPKCCAASLFCAIMDDSAVCSIGADGSEAWLNIIFLLFPEGGKILFCTDLIHADLSDILFQPVHKMSYRNAILQMCFSEVFHFRFILHCLHQHGGILPVNDAGILRKLLL